MTLKPTQKISSKKVKKCDPWKWNLPVKGHTQSFKSLLLRQRKRAKWAKLKEIIINSRKNNNKIHECLPVEFHVCPPYYYYSYYYSYYRSFNCHLPCPESNVHNHNRFLFLFHCLMILKSYFIFPYIWAFPVPKKNRYYAWQTWILCQKWCLYRYLP